MARKPWKQHTRPFKSADKTLRGSQKAAPTGFSEARPDMIRTVRRHSTSLLFDDPAGQPDLPAGRFSAWLRHARRALLLENGTKVDCRGCDACCSSSSFIPIRPEETRTLGRIPRKLLVAAPGLPKGHVLLGYDRNGHCPMLIQGRCSIYEHRPLTCRNYDCRIFAAAGIAAGGDDKARITRRVMRWRFRYPSRRDRDEQAAVRAAAKFIDGHAECFPGGKIPDHPVQLAVLAVEVYDVFLKIKEETAQAGCGLSDSDVADAIVKACRKFDERRHALFLNRRRNAMKIKKPVDRQSRRLSGFWSHPAVFPRAAAQSPGHDILLGRRPHGKRIRRNTFW